MSTAITVGLVSKMRKLARQAVIFMLFSTAISSIGGYVYLCVEQSQIKYLENLGIILTFGPGGFVAGFGIWLFYRVVLFAVKG
jgi:hypothetical protein